MDTLEHRIASALSAASITSSELTALIQATEAAIVEAHKIAEQERLKALDPLRSPNAAQARQAMEDAAFACDRLRTVLPRLQESFSKIAAGEAYNDWVINAYEPVKAERDAAAAELRALYAPFVIKMADLLLRIEKIDGAIRRVNDTRPRCESANGDGRHLQSVETEARDAGRLGETSICRDAKLPNWRPGDGYAWPINRLALPFHLSEFEAKQVAEQQEQVRRRAIAVAEEVERQQAAE
jgi:hypothetical protein